MPRGGAVARRLRPQFVPDQLYESAFALWTSGLPAPEVYALARKMAQGDHIYPRSAMPTVLRCQTYDQAVKPLIVERSDRESCATTP